MAYEITATDIAELTKKMSVAEACREMARRATAAEVGDLLAELTAKREEMATQAYEDGIGSEFAIGLDVGLDALRERLVALTHGGRP